MKVVYVAGAFRAPTAWEIQQNVRAAEAAALEVAKLGASPLCPHKNTEHFHGTLPDEFWLEATRELLRRCDAAYIFNRWHLSTSAGTRGERELAEKLGIPLFFSLEALAVWLRHGEACS